ncbi:MAG: filamentous hemagglutinin N-terminal domain-containing protein [Bacillota bacterium]
MKQSRKIRRSWLRVIPEWMRCFARSVIKVIKLSSSRVIKSVKIVGEGCSTFSRAINYGLRTLNSGLKAHTKEWAAAALAAGLIVMPLSVDMAAGGLRLAAVNAAPEGGVVVGGAATIQQQADVTTISQTSQRAAIDWTSFIIAPKETVNFVQPNAQAVALNRVLGNNPTEIYGHLNANGQVYLSNPNGMLFAPGAQVNVAGLIATTSHVDPLAFMQSGLINTSEHNAAIDMQGSIFATGGLVEIKGASAINVGGIIRAVKVQNSESRVQSLTTNSPTATQDSELRTLNSSDGGVITLESGGDTINTGTLDVSSASGNGGKVTMLGDHVGLLDSAVINADGASGGGTVRIGGGWQGGEGLPQASATVMAPTASISANATNAGNGGSVALWSKDYTGFYGTINARALGQSGDGGNVETSSHDNLQAFGNVNAGSINGIAGQWLLDPANVTISTSATSGMKPFGTHPNTFEPDSNIDSANIQASSIQSTLVTSDVVLTTTNYGSPAGAGAADGNITVSGTPTPTISWSTNKTLTFQAGGKIDLTGLIITNNGGGSLTLSSGSNATAASGNITLGAISLTGGSGCLSLSAQKAGATITQVASTSLSVPSLEITTNAGAVTLNNTGNIIPFINSLDTTDGGNAAGGASADIRTNGALTIAEINTGGRGNLTLTAGGAIDQTADPSFYLSVGGTTAINAGAHDITLTNSPDSGSGYPGNSFGGTVSATGNNVSLIAARGIDLGDSTVAGTLTVIANADKSADNISISAGHTVTADKIFLNTAGSSTNTARGYVVNSGTITHSGSAARLFIYARKGSGNWLGTITGFGTVPAAVEGTLNYAGSYNAICVQLHSYGIYSFTSD